MPRPALRSYPPRLHFFTKVASAPPIPVTIMGMAAAVIPSSTQSFNTFFVFHSLPVSSRDRMQPVNRAARGLPIKEQKSATGVSGTITEAPVLIRSESGGTRWGAGFRQGRKLHGFVLCRRFQEFLLRGNRCFQGKAVQGGSDNAGNGYNGSPHDGLSQGNI